MLGHARCGCTARRAAQAARNHPPPPRTRPSSPTTIPSHNIPCAEDDAEYGGHFIQILVLVSSHLAHADQGVLRRGTPARHAAGADDMADDEARRDSAPPQTQRALAEAA